ncbi:uncharacterized protein EpC_08240 [Erwinia pyrifoliae Ep1/96]|nr:uncharacterized protein EpC_08240 [Erwinia pyrifoliae Ep1/96]
MMILAGKLHTSLLIFQYGFNATAGSENRCKYIYNCLHGSEKSLTINNIYRYFLSCLFSSKISTRSSYA